MFYLLSAEESPMRVSGNKHVPAWVIPNPDMDSYRNLPRTGLKKCFQCTAPLPNPSRLLSPRIVQLGIASDIPRKLVNVDKCYLFCFYSIADDTALFSAHYLHYNPPLRSGCGDDV